MRKRIVTTFAALALALVAGNAMAENIKGRIGVTGRFGFLVPADSEITNTGVPILTVDTDTGFVGGGGVMYGITKNIAAEIDITHADFGTSALGVNTGDGSITNISLGGQYRFDVPVKNLVPFAGGGLDILINDLEGNVDVDTVAGVHITGGADYFILPQLAVTAELKGVLAPTADINFAGSKVGNFDPSSFSMTFGARFFFN